MSDLSQNKKGRCGAVVVHFQESQEREMSKQTPIEQSKARVAELNAKVAEYRAIEAAARAGMEAAPAGDDFNIVIAETERLSLQAQAARRMVVALEAQAQAATQELQQREREEMQARAAALQTQIAALEDVLTAHLGDAYAVVTQLVQLERAWCVVSGMPSNVMAGAIDANSVRERLLQALDFTGRYTLMGGSDGNLVQAVRHEGA